MIVCEGSTEVGCIRAFDSLKFEAGETPVWSCATSYFCCSGGSDAKASAPKLQSLGYDVAILCDNDSEEQISVSDVARLEAGNIFVCQWDAGNATEHQLFGDMPWQHVPKLLETIASGRGMQVTSLVDLVLKDDRTKMLSLSTTPQYWPETAVVRRVLGDLAHKHDWFKRIDLAENVFRFALPLLPASCVTTSRLEALWLWLQCE